MRPALCFLHFSAALFDEYIELGFFFQIIEVGHYCLLTISDPNHINYLLVYSRYIQVSILSEILLHQTVKKYFSLIQ